MLQLYTIGEVLRYIEKNYDNPKAVATFAEGKWTSLTTKEFIEQIKYAALGLISLGVKRGEKVGILAIPCSRWTIADYAIMAIGAVSVPIFANISSEHFIFEVTQPQITKLFVFGEEQWKLATAHKELFQKLISLDGYTGGITYEELMRLGKEYDKSHSGYYQELLSSLKPGELATIIYTSGSTGVPKGAMHTHRSLCSLLPVDCFKWDGNSDTFLSFLPLAHVFARILNLIMIAWGVSVYYYNDIKSIGEACKEIRPTVMIVVPRVLEKMYAKMLAKVSEGSFIKRTLGNYAFKLAHQEKKGFLSPLMDLLVYKKLRGALGGNLRVVISGGAALNPRLYQFFLNAGFPIYEGWGLTESCPVSANQIGKVKIGTVGPPIPGMLVKVGEGGELLVAGEMLMSGYFKNETKAIDEDGWFHTGDKGTIDQEGYITLIGRIKELFKTSTGEMVAPVPIEQALSKSPFVEIPMVIADNKKFVSCLIFPNFDAVKKLKEKQGMGQMEDEAFLQSAYMKKEMTELLSAVNANLNEWEQIRDYRIIPSQLTVESGELTPSMKVKREAVEKKFSDLIESIYNKDSA